MEYDLVYRKLESLRRCIMRIEEKRPGSAGILASDYDLQDIISVNLERSVQISVDIGAVLISEFDRPAPSTMADTFTVLSAEGVLPEDLALRLRKSVGFRNISVHEYEKIDWNIVFSIITLHLSDFRMYAANVLEYVESHQ